MRWPHSLWRASYMTFTHTKGSPKKDHSTDRWRECDTDKGKGSKKAQIVADII